MRQQLDLWARQAAKVRAGGLHLGCKLDNCDIVECVCVSPGADQVATLLLDDASSVMLVPITGTQLDLASQLSDPPSGATLAPSGAPGLVVSMCWSPAGQQLVLVSAEETAAAFIALRVSAFQGTQLVGSFLVDDADYDDDDADDVSVHVSDDAAVIFLVLPAGGGGRVVAGTAQGAVTARHPGVDCALSTALLHCNALLAASKGGDKLYVWSATCAQEIGLHGTAADSMDVRFSAWGALVAVARNARVGRGVPELLLVDMVHQTVQHRVQLPQRYDCVTCGVAQGARSLALVLDQGHVSAVATSGGAVGRELFSCPGSKAAWDPLGRFLAVVRYDTQTAGPRVHILDGLTGAESALWQLRAQAVVLCLCWLPGGHALKANIWVGDMQGAASWFVLRFACSQPAMK